MSARTPSRQPSQRRRFQPRLELLEDRLTPAGLPADTAALTFFDPGTSWLAVRAANAVVTIDAGGAVAVTLAGQMHSSNPSSAAFDPALAGANAWSLRGISLQGGTADTLTLADLNTGGDLAVQSDGAVTLADSVQ